MWVEGECIDGHVATRVKQLLKNSLVLSNHTMCVCVYRHEAFSRLSLAACVIVSTCVKFSWLDYHTSFDWCKESNLVCACKYSIIKIGLSVYNSTIIASLQ